MKPMPTNRHREQSGAVLVIAMVILLMLTLLGVTAMNTTSLEEKMASNSQEQKQATQSADTGYSEAFADAGAYEGDTCAGGNEEAPVTVANFSGSDNTLTYCSRQRGYSNVPPEYAEDWGEGFQAMHFNMRSSGTTPGGLSVTVNGGAYLVVPKL